MIKVFISWSGGRSLQAAKALRDWLPNVIQAVEPWLSPEDLEKGARWGTEIATQLSDSRFGIISLTKDILEAPWILFEAGALSKTVEKTFVCPYLLDLNPSDLKGPLAQFQACKADKEETKKLLFTINKALEKEALGKENLGKIFEKWWPDLENSFKKIPPSEEKDQPIRNERELIEEILYIVRGLARIEGENTQEKWNKDFAETLAAAKKSLAHEAWINLVCQSTDMRPTKADYPSRKGTKKNGLR